MNFDDPQDVFRTDDVHLLQDMYAAELRFLAAGGPGKADFAELAPFFTPDVTLHQADSLPYGGVWRGREGMERCMIAMSDTWASFEMVEQTFLATRSPLVVLTQVRAQARATGRTLAFPILQTVVVTGNRIAEVRPFYWDTVVVAQASHVDSTL